MEERRNGMKVALSVTNRAPGLTGPTEHSLLLLAGIAREVDTRNSTITDLMSETETLLGFYHSGHEPGTLYTDCQTETCKRAAAVLDSGDMILSRVAAYPLT